MNRTSAVAIPDKPEIPQPRRASPPALPPSFDDELERYLAWLLDPENGLDRTYAAATITQRRRELRLAAATLATRWGDPVRVSALRILVVPANAQCILEHYLARTADGKPTAFIHALASDLVVLARDWVKPPADELTQLVELRRHLGTRPTGPTAKNARLLRALADSDRCAALLALPTTLADDARAARLHPNQRRQGWRTAVAIELLLHTGMRLHQLATLRIGEHITWPDGPDGTLRVRAPDRQMRDGTPLEFDLVGAPKTLVEEYLARFTPRADTRPLRWLFAHRNGSRVCDGALADGIAKATHRRIGLRISPHQLRHVCAMLLLTADPDDFSTVKDLRGDQFLESTLALYGHDQSQSAIAEWNARLAQSHAQPTSTEAGYAQAN